MMTREELSKILCVVQAAGYLALWGADPPKSKKLRKLNRLAFNNTLKDFKRQVKKLKVIK